MVHVHQGKTHVASPLEIIVYGSKRKKNSTTGGDSPKSPGLCFKKMLCFKTWLGMGVSTTPEVQHSNRFTARRLPIIYGLKAWMWGTHIWFLNTNVNLTVRNCKKKWFLVYFMNNKFDKYYTWLYSCRSVCQHVLLILTEVRYVIVPKVKKTLFSSFHGRASHLLHFILVKKTLK